MRSLFSGLLGLFIFCSPAFAEKPKEIYWDNLIPNMGVPDNPVMGLSPNNQYDLRMLHNIRKLKEDGNITPADPQYKEGEELTQKLERKGLDVNLMVKAFDELLAEIKRRNMVPNKELNGQLVRIPGYALPLEYSETAVKEMLLVPNIGACIHTPPPPANQIVYVDMKQPYKAKKLYEPIWVTGRLKVVSTQKSVAYSDGGSEVESVYTLEAISVEPYEN